MAGNTSDCRKLIVLFLMSAMVYFQLHPAHAQPRSDACRLIAQNQPIWRASQPLNRDEVRLTFVGHSTFLIESPKGILIETDYNDYVRSGRVPNIATMNKAHSTHFSYAPDPRIAHVLPGWGETPETPAHYELSLQDVLVRNIPTNIRTYRGTETNGNSIFVFEVAGLCIGHLGHLHHPLEPEQLRDIGKIDVLLVPVDGSWTLDLTGMVEVVKSLSPTLVVPMHYFNKWTLSRFVEHMRGEWQVDERLDPVIVLSRSSLPSQPQLIILPGQ